MPKRDPDQPPADAGILALHRSGAAGNTTSPGSGRRERPAATDVNAVAFYSTWMGHDRPRSYSTTNPRWGEYRQALDAANADFRRRLLSGELLAWGADTPWGPLRVNIRPDAWTAIAVVNPKKGIVRGPKPAATRLYGVVVYRRAEASKRGRHP